MEARQFYNDCNCGAVPLLISEILLFLAAWINNHFSTVASELYDLGASGTY